MLKREGFDFEKFAKKVRRLSIVRAMCQLVTSQAMQDTVRTAETTAATRSTSSSFLPRVSFPLSPSAHKEFAVEVDH